MTSEQSIIVAIYSAIIGTMSFLWQVVKSIVLRAKEKSNKLDLKLCDEIALDNHEYTIKIINISPNATAYNLHASFYIINKLKGYHYQLPDFNAQHHIYSVKQDSDPKTHEILIKIDVMRISLKALSEASIYIKDYHRNERLELIHFLEDRGTYLAVRYNAVNALTKSPNDYPMKTFTIKNLKRGFFGVGNAYVTEK